MIYVGKSNPNDKVRKCHEIIDSDQLSYIFRLNDYYDYVWFFYVKLNGISTSKLQHGMTIETDNIIQEILTMLTNNDYEQGWAVF